MKKLSLFLSLALAAFAADAQFVTIPDANFRNWLVQNHPSCMNANQEMDVNCVDGITSLAVSNLGISDLNGIQYFDSLDMLICSSNQLTSLPTLSNNLTELWCDNNLLTTLPSLPNSLRHLRCNLNQLTVLPTLPSIFYSLNCGNNNLTSLPNLPSTIYSLSCERNNLTTLPTLPTNLSQLSCYENQLTSLPMLPNPALRTLYCFGNQLTSLPTLPDSLNTLDCGLNSISTLPPLPSKLGSLSLGSNPLSFLPNLPSSLGYLDLGNLPITCFPIYQGSSLFVFGETSTYLTCLPPNVQSSFLPTCTNPSQICGASEISGKIYIDYNTNGIFDAGDYPISMQSIGADDSNGSSAWAITNANGGYAIFTNPSANNYLVSPPVNNTNYYAITPTIISTSIPNIGMTSSNNDFVLIPNGSHNDLEAHFVGGNPLGHRPGFDTRYDLYYQNQGTTTQDAQLVFTADAGLTFVSSSVAPTSISGNVYTWDFTNLAPFDHGQIQLIFNVPTTFVIGDSVDASLDISSVNVDETPSDNLQTTIYPIINGYDPNDKQVSKTELSPSEVAAGRELSYLIRFQNTGNAEAINVMIIDELSENLDIASLEILGSSHDMVSQLSGAGKLQFYFANIMLPDSNTNEPASHGYVAYRIKPKTDLVVGDQVHNTANIYFDYNPAIVTNTVTTTVVIPTGKDLAKVANLTAYPVPVLNELNVEWSGEAQVTSIEVSNLAGQIVSKQEINSTNTAKIDFSHFTQGVYLISLMNGAEKVGIQKVVK